MFIPIFQSIDKVHTNLIDHTHLLHRTTDPLQLRQFIHLPNQGPTQWVQIIYNDLFIFTEILLKKYIQHHYSQNLPSKPEISTQSCDQTHNASASQSTIFLNIMNQAYTGALKTFKVHLIVEIGVEAYLHMVN